MYNFNAISLSAFEDELEKIAQATMEKTAGPLDFLAKGIKGWQSAARSAAKAATPAGVAARAAGSARLPGRTWGSHPGLIKKIYQRGARQGGEGLRGVWGGVKGVAKSPYGAMAGTAGVGALAAGGAYNALPSFRGNQQQQRY